MTSEDKQVNSEIDYSEDGFSVYMRWIRDIPLLTAEEERELAVRCAQGDEEAIRKMVSSNLRLVVSVAKEYNDKGVPLLDLIQSGSIGLIDAAKRFDYKRNTRFSTYATPWIRQGVVDCLVDHKNMVTISKYASERIKKVLQTKMQLKKETGVEPTVQEVAQVCEMPVEKVEKYLQVSTRMKSLDKHEGDDEYYDPYEMIEDHDARRPQDEFVRQELKNALEKLLSMLDERQQMVLRMHFGMDNNVGCSLEAISVHFGVSKERIRQIEQQAMAKLKRLGANLELEAFLYE